VDVYLEIENEWDEIPTDTRALVGNRSALGEQYVELQPNVEVDEDGDGPFLEEDSEITDVAIPIATEKLLGDIATTVSSVDQDALRTTVEELGIAFNGTGEDLQRIIDTGNSFIETANANFDITTALIRDSNTVLQTQVDSRSSLRTFANQLSIFSGAMVGADDDLRRVIDSGSFTANQLRTFLEQNEAEVSDLLKNVILTGRVAVANIDGFRSLLIAYPILLEGSFTVVDKNATTNLYETHVGLILNADSHPCHAGYESTDKRPPNNVEDRPLNQDARCTEPPTLSNPRGYQNLPENLPRVRPDLDGIPDAGETIIGTYDSETGTFEAGAGRTSPNPALAPSGNVAPPSLGEDSWKWLYLEPLLDVQE
jgi:phospholipid/cholesterol/gamma-HCH transport system substrate-binding protein